MQCTPCSACTRPTIACMRVPDRRLHTDPTTARIVGLYCLLLQGYMPGQLYKLDSSYGTEQQLTELCAKLRDGGIDPLADIVINHRCGYLGVHSHSWAVACTIMPCCQNSQTALRHLQNASCID